MLGTHYPQLHETFRAKKTHIELCFNEFFYEMVLPAGQSPDPELLLTAQYDLTGRGAELYASEPALQLLWREFTQKLGRSRLYFLSEGSLFGYKPKWFNLRYFPFDLGRRTLSDNRRKDKSRSNAPPYIIDSR